ncbi:MAG TPA: septum site-determining protein Ssd [Mycobacteriales bacterium]|nr:septum site-determining protein Ssd [Mycobacteriales bacterium]
MPPPLLVTTDPLALDDLLRLAALAGVDADVVQDLGEVRRLWDHAPLVLVGEDVLDELVAQRLARRDGVLVLGRDLDDAGVWQRAVDLGAQRVVFLPDAERWLAEALADAVEGGAERGSVLAVVGGRGGAGATTLACALAQTAARRGTSTLLVDGDPLGGGIDVVFRAEEASGVRWPDLAGTRGRIPAAALARGLPRVADLALLSWDRGDAVQVPVEAARAVLSAARRSHSLVVVDVPRHVDEVGREVLLAATTTLLLVPAEVRAAAAAARVAARLAQHCRDVRLVVRGPAPAGLTAEEVERALGLPLVGEVRAEPHLARSLEEGELPAARRGSPLGGLCHALLDALLVPELRAA